MLNKPIRSCMSALEALSPIQRQIIILRYYEGNSLKEIAERLSLSYGICKLQHKAALKTLNRLMDK